MSTKLPSVAELINKLGLQGHPEGGYFHRTYECDIKVDNDLKVHADRGLKILPRHLSTAIYFLLPRGSVSHLHRIPCDEMWHFYLGGPLAVVEIDESSGELKETIIGSDLMNGQLLQYVVPAGKIFGAYPCADTEYALVGCTVSPGFEFGDFELFSRAELIAKFPEHMHQLIIKMTPDHDDDS